MDICRVLLGGGGSKVRSPLSYVASGIVEGFGFADSLWGGWVFSSTAEEGICRLALVFIVEERFVKAVEGCI